MLLVIQQNVLITVAIILLLLSITCQIIIGVLYQRIIKEADNMSTTDNKLLKQCKMKFANCYQLNTGVTNIPIFVEKFINKISFGKLTISGIGHLSGQLIMLSVLASGIGAYRGIVGGDTVGELLPYYIISLFGLYVYFSVTLLVDIAGKKKVLKTNLIDFLENHMANRLRTSKEEVTIQKELEKEMQREIQQAKPSFFTKSDEQELEELLKEFLT